MTLVFTTKLGLRPKPTNVGIQKIDSSFLEIYCMVSASFSLQNSLEKVWFFKETFLLTDTSIEMVLQISFLSFGNINIEFTELEKLT